MRDIIIENVCKYKLIAILRNIPSEKLIPLADALYNGGIRLLEITYSADGSIPDEKTAENIKMLSTHFQDKMFIGAGTVLTEKQVELTKENGGLFIISPDTCPEIIKKTRELNLVSMPGALTPSEVQIAHKAGADFIKLFPITNLGVDYVKAIKAPLSHVKLLAVGGICEDNMSDYLKSGICGFGIGSNITPKNLIEQEDYPAITKLAQKYVLAVK